MFRKQKQVGTNWVQQKIPKQLQIANNKFLAIKITQ